MSPTLLASCSCGEFPIPRLSQPQSQLLSRKSRVYYIEAQLDVVIKLLSKTPEDMVALVSEWALLCFQCIAVQGTVQCVIAQYNL